MNRPLFAAALLGAALSTTGCGTVGNLLIPSKEPKVYGGVRLDIDVIDKITHDEPLGTNTLSNGGTGEAIGAAVLVLGPFLDLPFSFLGDTLTLPVTRWIDNRRSADSPSK